jgi:DNA adenine methylase
MKKPTRPALRYFGGKWRIAPWIISHFPPHKIYTESFGGAAGVLLRKPRVYAEVYNDLDGEVCNLFRVLRNPVQGLELQRQLKLTPFAREEFELSYLADGDPIEQARRTIIRAFQGFGSDGVTGEHRTGFRVNANQSRTSPAPDWVSYADSLHLFVERLRTVAIEQKPAVDVMVQHDTPRTLHYVDPPYVWSTRKISRGHGYRHEMSDDDHRSLAEVLRSLQGMVILSGYASDLYDIELFSDWKRVEREALADGAEKRTEVLWLNPQACAHQPMMEVHHE